MTKIPPTQMPKTSACGRDKSGRFELHDTVDELSGRRLRRLTPDGINVSPYFNSHAWTADGDRVFFIRLEAEGAYVAVLAVATGEYQLLAGPFPLPGEVQQKGDLHWATLNAVPGAGNGATNGAGAATFLAENWVWLVTLDANGDLAECHRLVELPFQHALYADSDVSSDGRWHVLAAGLLSHAGWEARGDLAWPLSPFFEKYLEKSVIFRVALDGSGIIETLFEEDGAFVSHISLNPADPDAILYCHEGGHAYQWGRVFLRRRGMEGKRALRDQSSGKVMVTHETWFKDGQRFAYHGAYLDHPAAWPPRDYAGYYDMVRELPVEFDIEGPRLASSHTVPSPDGTRLLMDLLPCEEAAPQCLYELLLDFESRTCRRVPVCAVASDQSELPINQWRTLDPIFSPDGRRVLMRIAQRGELLLYLVEL